MRRLFLAGLLSFWAAGAASAQVGPSGPRDDPRLQQTLAYLKQHYLHPRPGASARGAAFAVVENGKLTLSGAIGVKNTLSAPVTTRTLFRIGSTSKMFTAIAAMQLAERKLLDVKAPVIRYTEPYFSTHSETMRRGITTEMCLTHTTGLKVLGPAEPWDGLQGDDAARLYFLENRDIPHDTPPPGPFHYNNLGFCLAGLVVSQASGEPFDAFVHENVFTPLGMVHATYDSHAASRTDHSWGWGKWPGDSHFGVREPYAITQIDHGARWPAGGLMASVLDLARFAEMLVGGRQPVLSSSTLYKMMTAHGPSNFGYGYGFFVGRHRTWYKIHHDGARPGYHSTFFVIPTQKFGAVVLLNGYYGRALEPLHADIADFFLLKKPYPTVP